MTYRFDSCTPSNKRESGGKVYTADLKSAGAGYAGSSPASRTNDKEIIVVRQVVINQVPVPGATYKAPKPVCTAALLDEVNLFACSPEAVNMYGGLHTIEALRQMLGNYEVPIRRAKDKGLSPIVDVRIHRLFADQYPCTPGWHCDFVPFGGYTAQPNFSACSEAAFSTCLTLSDQGGGVSSSEYVATPLRLCLEDPNHVYRELHREIERVKPYTISAPDGVFMWYNQRTMHRARPAWRGGYRLYMRFSMVEKPMLMNVHHSPPQVYVIEGNGW